MSSLASCIGWEKITYHNSGSSVIRVLEQFAENCATSGVLAADVLDRDNHALLLRVVTNRAHHLGRHQLLFN